MAEANPADDFDYKKLKSDVENRLSKEHELQKIEERSEDCSITVEQWKGIFQGKYKTVWRGLTLMKSPFEVVTYQQMLWDIKPATILEIGSYDGGSALWMADILAMYGCNSHIYSVDIDLSLVNSLAQERQDITFIEGDVNDVEKVLSTELLKSLPHPWFVSEDAHQNVVGVLDYLDRFSEPGDYFIVEDTSPRTPLHDLDDLTKWGRWKLDAVSEFVKKHPTRYRVDKEYTDRFGYNVSCNMNSYLRRI